MFLVGRLDASAGALLNQPDNHVERDIAQDAGNQAIRDTIREGHDGDGQKGGNCVSVVLPVDLGGGFGHHRPDDDESTPCCPWGNGCEDGRKENGDEEADSGHARGEAGLAAF